MISLHSPFKPWESNHGKNFSLGGAGEAAAAALYVASNVYSWSEARQMPKRQAEANKEVLRLQKEHYDQITAEMRTILQGAVATYIDETNSLIYSDEFISAFPDVPDAAEYVPVDPCCEQLSTIECNISTADRADALSRYVTRLHEQNDLTHALSFNPTFLTDLDMMFQGIQALMRGQSPVGDIIDVVSDNAERAALHGRIGNTKRTTARDLGLSKMRAQAAGRQEFRESTAWVGQAVSPLQRVADIRAMQTGPGERIALALSQAQLIQASLQNKNNSLAQKDPYLMARVQAKVQSHITKLQMKASEALLQNNFVPNYASIVAPKVENTSMLLGGIGSAIQNANSSWFFGAPAKGQEGYRGETQNTPQATRTTTKKATEDPFAGFRF